MRRREFITLLGGAAVAWPCAAQAQTDKLRRVGVLMGYAENDPEAQIRFAAFVKRLAALGWIEGNNLRMEVRWSAGDVNRATALAKELVSLKPEVILANTTPVSNALQRQTQTIPLVFVVVSDPIGSGFVQSLSRPGGNMTGFINLEASMVEKWLEFLKEIAPSVTRAAVMFNSQTAPYAEYYLKHVRMSARILGIDPVVADVQSEAEIEATIAKLGREVGNGLVVITDSFMTVHRRAIIRSTTLHKVATVSFLSNMARDGALISYGVDVADLFQRSADYVDRILRGAKPADLPVQAPTKFELVLNLKTAKALGLEVPTTLLVRANEVIE